MATTSSNEVTEKLTNLFKRHFSIVTKEKYDIKQDSEFNFKNICSNVNFEQQAKDDFGNLHPMYAQVVRKGYEGVSDYVELYTRDILDAVRQIDLLCIKTSDRRHDNYEKCKAQTNQQLRKKIFVPIVNSSAFLYKVANLCMLKGHNSEMCSKIVGDHTYFMFKLAAQRTKLITQPLEKQIPKELQPPTKTGTMNNAIPDD